MTRVCTICARGGSKGVKNKNLRLLSGKPLIVHSIEQALSSELFDVIGVSSDSHEILNVARDAGAHELIERPAELSTDAAAKIPVIRHCAIEIEKRVGAIFDTYVDMDCTSPLRAVEDIRDAVLMFESRKPRNLITGSPARRSPYFNLVERQPNGVVTLAKKPEVPIVRRQDAPRCFDMNASIYIWKRDSLMNDSTLFLEDTILFEMPEDRSIDIDSELDFKIVELLMKER